MEQLQAIHIYFKIAAIFFTIIGVLISGFWAYIVYALGRGVIPAAQFEIMVTEIGNKSINNIVEIHYIIENKGQYPLIVSDLRTKIRYIDGDKLDIEKDPNNPNYCHIIFPKSLGRLIKTGNPTSTDDIDTSLPIIDGNTFIQPGVSQKYNYSVLMPQKAEYVLIKGMFDYVTSPLGVITKSILYIGSLIKLIPFEFQNIKKPHSAETVYKFNNA